MKGKKTNPVDKAPRTATKADIEREASAARERLMETMLNPEIRTQSITEICRKAKCDRSTYYRAFENASFVEDYKRRSKDLVIQGIGPVVNAIINQAAFGNVQAAKIVLEMAGIYTESREIRTPDGKGIPIKIEGLKQLPAEVLEKFADQA
jgi:hypothetical protein